MRAASEKLCMAKSVQISQLQTQEIQQLAEFGAISEIMNVRVNLVNMLGTIGQIQSKDGQLIISNFLIEAASRDVELRVVSEALDKIFDLFSEDESDELCKNVDLVSKLKKMQPGFKTKMSMYKQKFGPKKGDSETITMANMAKTNLGRFIKYKEKRCK